MDWPFVVYHWAQYPHQQQHCLSQLNSETVAEIEFQEILKMVLSAVDVEYRYSVSLRTSLNRLMAKTYFEALLAV